jgi:hypothetical protein
LDASVAATLRIVRFGRAERRRCPNWTGTGRIAAAARCTFDSDAPRHRVHDGRCVGLQGIELDTVLGTVGRERGGFDREFRPTTARVRARWERIANAARRGEPLPPIAVYRIGAVRFVRDGHHRVSVARALGRDTIDAHVVEVVTRVGAERSLRVGDLPLKSHERLFHERVPLPARARERIRLGDPWDFGRLAEGVEASSSACAIPTATRSAERPQRSATLRPSKKPSVERISSSSS